MRTIQSDQLGELQVADEAVIRFPEGIPGFEEHREYTLVALEEIAPFEWLQSLDEPSLCFAVVDPAVIHPEYAPRLGSGELAAVEAQGPEEVMLRVILTLSPNPEEITANLQAPLVIHRDKRLATQVLLTRSPYDTRHRVVEGMQA
ncbi:MAG: flagellar assembly protein FliW [Nitrospirae bacterium]|nr:MAG: flagellar assembly protein FliW [Nitrospirota bacterium]